VFPKDIKRSTVICKHLIVVEPVVTGPGHSEIIVLDCRHAYPFREAFELPRLEVSFLALFLAALAHPGLEVLFCPVPCLVQKVKQLDALARSRFELFAVGTQHESEGHVVEPRLRQRPLREPGGREYHLEVV